MSAVDISADVVRVAQEGVYGFGASGLVHTCVFERTTEKEMQAMFDRDGERAKVKSWMKEGIRWQVADAGDPELVTRLGRQDIVVANNFLCHMDPPNAERCLRNIARLVKPDGHLLASGVDLDVRTKVARDSDWIPVRELLEEIHEGDPCMRQDWPWKYWGLEPLNKKRADWVVRYAAAFQIGNHQ